MNETFGQRFARLRKKLGYKQEDIGNKVDVSPQAVSKWENDLSAPDISLLPELADILNVTLDELLGRKIIETKIVPEHERKNLTNMILKIQVLGADGDKIKINLPLSIIKICLESNQDLPSIGGKNILSSIDFKQIFELIEAGVVGNLVEVESNEGDIVNIYVE